MLGLCRAVCAVPAAHVRCFTGRAVLSRELLYGIRPPSSAIQTHIASLARAGRLREAIVEAYSAARAHVDVGKPTILHLMTAAARLPAAERAECSDAVLRLSDMLLFTPETDRTVVAARLESTSPVGLPVCAASGPMPLVRTLTQREFESALSALAVCGHHARILQLAEHALHQNGRAVLSRQFLASVIDALASACASLRYSEARILETYAGARALLSAAGVQKLDSKLACCLLTLLLGGRHLSVWGATRRLASYVAVAAENSVAAAAAAVELTGGASEAAAPAVGGDAAHADAAQHTAGQVFHTVETAAEAAFAAARSLTARPEGEDPLLVAAATLLAEVPAEELTRAGVKDKLTFDAAGSAVAIADDGKGRGGVLPHLITLCVQRGRRDRALQLIGALVERGIAVPPAPFNQLILADAQGSSAPLAAARGHVRAMQTAGVVPNAGTVAALLRAFLAERQLLLQQASARPQIDSASSIGPADSASFIRDVCAALSVPIDNSILQVAAEAAVLREDVDDLAAVLSLAQEVGMRRGGKPMRTSPRWLLRIAGELPRLRRASGSAATVVPPAGVAMDAAALASAAARSIASRLA